jgi:tetratricopeptide (TPR) repeat protein
VSQDATQLSTPLPTLVQPTTDRKIEPPCASVETGSVELKDLYFVQIGDQLRMVATFSRMPAYRLIQRAQGRQLVLELAAGTKVAPLPDSGIPPILNNMVCETHNDRIQLVFFFNQGYRYDESILIANSDGESRNLIMVTRPEPSDSGQKSEVVAPSPSKPSVTAPDAPRNDESLPAAEASSNATAFVRQAVRPTNRQQAEKLFQIGITAFQKGRFAKAEQALKAALTIEPSDVEIRDALLHLLDRQDRRDQVEAVLVDGLRNAPTHWPYRIQLVRLLIQAGNLSQANSELMRDPFPPAAECPDLHAMLATVCLRQGRYREAADVYRTLLAVKPEQAAWWMGFGISLEGDAAFDQAREAYHQALARDGLSESLRGFIRQRMAASKNTPTGRPSGNHTVEEARS